MFGLGPFLASLFKCLLNEYGCIAVFSFTPCDSEDFDGYHLSFLDIGVSEQEEEGDRAADTWSKKH